MVLMLHSNQAQEAEEVESKNVALLRPAEQSSTFASGDAAFAVDGNLETCSSTEEFKNDYQRWWAVELPRPVNVKEVAVTINHAVAFHQQFTVFVIARSGDMRTKFHKCAGFAGILRAGRRQQLECPPDGIVGEKVYIRDDRREGTLSLCEVEVVAHSGGICSEPPDILNGRHSVLGGTQQQLRYQCEAGYLLWGPSDLVCLANNTWSSPPPLCSPITCGYPHVEDANAVVEKSSYNIEMSQGAQIGDEAIVVCAKNYQMITNATSTSVEAVDHVRVVCSDEGMWKTAYPYKCLNHTVIAKMLPSLDLASVPAKGSPNSENFSLHSVVFTLVSVVLFLVLCLLLTCLLRARRMRAIKRRTEVNVTWPRNVQADASMAKSSRPLMTVFTTDSSSDHHPKKNSFGSSTASLVHAQHSGSSAKLIPFEDTSAGTATIHVGRRYTSQAKKISYEDDFQLPDSGSLVQGVSVDPHSAVFGKHGQRLDTTTNTDKGELTGLPDVTASPGYYHKNSSTGFSTFQSPTSATSVVPLMSKEATTSLWQSVPPPLLPPPVTTNETWRPSSPERGSLPSSDPGTRLFSAVRSLNDSVIMSPPDKFTNGELPELDEAGYASLILRTVKSDKVAEPVYERIKGERSISREMLTTTTTTAAIATGSDSGESHAYYSRVAKDFSLEPPPLKEHLYQNFDQVFRAMEDQRKHQKQHPDLLESTPNADVAEQFYENTRSLSPSKEVVVNDEKLRYMYAQVDVIKKHFDRSNRAYQSLQVMDHSSGGHTSPKLHDVGTIRTAWEEVL